jgi:hypothetical protein
MASPFPGMDPYLETATLWPEVHSWLIIQLARTLNHQLPPHYRAAVEQRVYSETLLIGIPDLSVFQTPRIAEPPPSPAATAIATRPIKVNLPIATDITERYLEIRLISTGEVVTVIEILSPKNKRAGEGRDQYLAKRNKLLLSPSNLIEIDLLRAGIPMPTSTQGQSHYRILVSRATDRPQAELYPIDLPEPLPSFALPLKSPDIEPIVNLQTILTDVYQEAALSRVIDYQQPIPSPKLSEADRTWVHQLLTA